MALLGIEIVFKLYFEVLTFFVDDTYYNNLDILAYYLFRLFSYCFKNTLFYNWIIAPESFSLKELL